MCTITETLYTITETLILSRKLIGSDFIRDVVEKYAAQGKTPLLFSRDAHLIGVIAVADTIRDSSRTAIEWRFSRLSADLIKMPYSAAFPVPTMIATGVASPKAHGHEIIYAGKRDCIPIRFYPGCG